MFWCTMAGVGVSAVIFMIIRQFAKPAPKTMNAQYQALTNEYLKVDQPAFYQKPASTDSSVSVVPKDGTNHRCIIRGLHRQRHDTEQAKERRDSFRRRRVASGCCIVWRPRCGPGKKPWRFKQAKDQCRSVLSSMVVGLVLFLNLSLLDREIAPL